MTQKTVALDHDLVVPLTSLELILIARLAQLDHHDADEFVRLVLADGVRHELLRDLREELARRVPFTGAEGE